MFRFLAQWFGITGTAAIAFLAIRLLQPSFATQQLQHTLALAPWIPIAAMLCLAALALPFHLLRLSWLLSLAALTMGTLHALQTVALAPVAAAALALALALCAALAIPSRARISLFWLLPLLALVLLTAALLGVGLRIDAALAALLVHSATTVAPSALQPGSAGMQLAALLPWLPWVGVAVFWVAPLRQRSQRPTAWLAFSIVCFALVPTASPSLHQLLALTALGCISLLETLHGLAFEDELTGVASRRALDDALRSLPARYSLALIDIDHFKKINDRHGHDAGDQVLRAVASRLRRTRGAEVFRYGGEEFALLFRRWPLQRALDAVDQMRRHIAAGSFIVRKKAKRRNPTGRLRRRGQKPRPQKAVRVRISAGVAERQANTPREVLRAADQALYKAKRAGRNRVLAAATQHRARGAKQRS